MNPTRTFRGLEVELKVSGFGRFGGAAFLAVWMAFWVVGETLVAWILIHGAWALVTGQPPGEGKPPLETGPALGVGLFLVAWLALWTLGGVLAGRELLRLLFGRDLIVAGPDGVTVERGFGLFRTRETIARDRLRGFRRRATGNILMADTAGGTVELTRLGAGDALGKLAEVLNGEYRLNPAVASGGALPRAWVEAVAPEGQAILIKDPAVRRKQAAIAWVAFVALATVAGFVIQAALATPSLGALGAILAAAAGFMAWGAYRLSYVRDEWRLETGRLRLQRRTRGRVETRFEAAGLRVKEERDSDGDPWYRLVATRHAAAGVLSPQEARKQERLLLGVAGDPAEALNFGRWLQHRCALPLDDGTTAEAQARERADLQRQLAASGRLGRWMARRLGSADGQRS
jgi:hypothetical protein